MEEIHPYVKPPWWTPTNRRTHIANMPKDKAKDEHQNFLKDNDTPSTLHIYTDGSGIGNQIGAAAYSLTTATTAHRYLGKADTANGYAAELTGIHLGIDMAGKSHKQYNKCFIYIHNQASIQAIDKPKQQSGQYIIQDTATLPEMKKQMKK